MTRTELSAQVAHFLCEFVPVEDHKLARAHLDYLLTKAELFGAASLAEELGGTPEYTLI